MSVIQMFTHAVSGGVVGMLIIYGLWCAINRQLIRLEPAVLALYMGVSFPISLSFEIFFGHLDEAIFSRQLWYYTTAPIHGGWTSAYNFAIWPLFGLHLYLYDRVMDKAKVSPARKFWVGLLKTALSGPLLEIITNLACLSLRGHYFFYYIPNDLWHLTSVQVIPYYATASLLLVFLIEKLKGTHRKVPVAVGFYLAGLCVLFL